MEKNFYTYNYITSYRKNDETQKNLLFSADIETILIDDQHFPLAIGFYNEDHCKIFSVWDEIGKETEDRDVIVAASNTIMNRFFRELFFFSKLYSMRLKIYFHNLSSFDGILIVDHFTRNDIFGGLMPLLST